jgi:hypothetical protein
MLSGRERLISLNRMLSLLFQVDLDTILCILWLSSKHEAGSLRIILLIKLIIPCHSIIILNLLCYILFIIGTVAVLLPQLHLKLLVKLLLCSCLTDCRSLLRFLVRMSLLVSCSLCREEICYLTGIYLPLLSRLYFLDY